MTKQKTKMIMAVILAILLAFLPLGVGYILFPDQTAQQPPVPVPTSKPESLLDGVLWAIQWIGLAAIIAITIVGAVLISNRIKGKKLDANVDVGAFGLQTKISQCSKVKSIFIFYFFKSVLYFC